MSDVPNSYKDPYWTQIASAAEAKAGIPEGLLQNIVTKGEKTNADQVSEAGAKTPFQITPQTRKLALDKYGVDAYLSPENAAEVAARLLKDSIDRNKGDTNLAVAEYHGGTDRANWGPKTKAYVQRVTGEQAPTNQTPQSTFQRVMAAQKTTEQTSIAAIYDAYKSGRMAPEDAKAFEDDVKAGMVMLPKGAFLTGENEPPRGVQVPEAILLPQGVTDAYVSGKMSPEDKAQLEQDIKDGLVKLPPSLVSQIPTEEPGWKPPTEQGIIAQPVDPSLGEKITGAGEAALSTVTGVTGGTLGLLGGAAGGLAGAIVSGKYGTQDAANLVEQAAMKGAQALTYAPRTESGQDYSRAVASGMEQIIPVMPMTAEMGLLGTGMKQAQPAISATSRAVTAPVISGAGRAAEAVQATASKAGQAIGSIPGKVGEMVGIKTPEPTPGTMASVGAAGTDVAAIRRAAAQELPVPVDLTEGQATRDFGQLRFEQEAAKNAELGAPIRERMAEQQKAVRQSFDAWIDETGAKAPDTRAVGISVDKALRQKAIRDKTEIRAAYKEADKAGETAQPVSTQQIVDTLNASTSAESTAPVLPAARKELIRLGGATEDANGALVAKDMTLADVEQLRKFVNKTTGADPTNVKFAGDIKRSIDGSTEGAGGELYQRARSLRAKYANEYENRAVIDDLLNNKRGSSDRKVALEDVFDRIVFRGSLDDMRHARKVLQTGGEDGRQAWKDIQGQAVRYIKEEATKNVQRDSYGNEVISPAALDKAVRRLDSEGKLDYLFGKRGAEQLRAVNDLAKVMFTTPPGAVNTSNTASVLLAAMDMAMSGTAGMPLPVLSGLKMIVSNIKDRKLKARIQAALGRKEQTQPSGKF